MRSGSGGRRAGDSPAVTRVVLRPLVLWGLVAYLVFGALWIFGSDSLLELAALSPDVAQRVALVKGLLFVLISAGWAGVLIRMNAPLADGRVSASSVSARPAWPGRLSLWMLLSALVLPALVASIYLMQARRLEVETAASLRALAEQGAAQLDAWLRERMGDAKAFSTDKVLLDALRSSDSAEIAALQQRLQTLSASYGYLSLQVEDGSGQTLAAVGSGLASEAEQVLATHVAPDGIQARWRMADNGIEVEFDAPLIDDGEQLGRLRLRQSLLPAQAAIVARARSLFASEEQVLVLAQRDEALLLIASGHAEGAPPRIERQPLSAEIPAAIAARSTAAGSVIGLDYRGVEVVAAFAPIAGTDWRVVAKVDRSELRGSLLPLVGWVSLAFALGLAALAVALSRLLRRERELEALHKLTLQAENDQLMRQFFELPFIGMAFTSPETKRWLRFNNRLCEILGYSREELAQLSWTEITHPDDLAADVDEFERVLRGESEGYAMSKRFLRKDGQVVHAMIQVRCQRRADRSIETFIASVDDISSDVAAREALQRSEQRLRRIITESPQPTIVLAEDGRIVELSDSWCAQSGYRREQLVSIEDWLQRAYDDLHRDAVRAHLDSLFGRGERIDEGDFQIRHADGNPRTWMFSAIPLQAEAGESRLLVATAVDVSQQRQLEHELETTGSMYRQMFDANPIAMYVWDAKTRALLAVNDASIERYGWSREEMLALRLDDLREPQHLPQFMQLVEALRGGAINRPGVLPHRRRDGHPLLVDITLHPMLFEGRAAWLTMAPDVTEREQARLEVERYVAKLEQATHATFEVISSMVELRDPYTAGHERRVGEIAAAIAGQMGLDAQMQTALRLCGAVHDVGKIAVPAEILSKPTRLSAAEYAIVQQHAALGYEILRKVDFPWPVAEVARQHHERIDGSGYPRGLKGEEILLEARIVAVADVIESMGSHRPYRPSIGIGLALAEIEHGRDRLYDRQVVDACLALFRDTGYTLPA